MEQINMKDIAIYGAGGLGREVACLIAEINSISPQWNFIGFIDDSAPETITPSSFGKHIGNIETLNAWSKELCVLLCFGSPRSIELVRNKITNPKISFPNLIHPSFIITDKNTFSIGEGNIITRGCSATCNVTIGNFNLLNGSISCGHDVTIGNYNVFLPGARVAGMVTIGNNNLFGAMSFIKQHLTIPNNITLGPLSALLTKPKSGNLYIGNPAKKFKY
jgi:sugar O-acyltransferase (sialic acid O-acetyltransferase NeuD family)